MTSASTPARRENETIWEHNVPGRGKQFGMMGQPKEEDPVLTESIHSGLVDFTGKSKNCKGK